ncbi:MAG: peptidase S8, partial [Pseudomonadota bacterium]|nr:peptidase S8 [Pseudomonadota bacterium]
MAQIAQRSKAVEEAVEDPDSAEASPAERRRFFEAVLAEPGISAELRRFVQGKIATPTAQQAADAAPTIPTDLERRRIEIAKYPPVTAPTERPIRAYAFDPLLETDLENVDINQTTIRLPWSGISSGPRDEYLEVLDVDPASQCCYAPVDPNHRYILAKDGLDPSESNPQFHQLMVYAVARKTIEHFERALGRAALWSPRRVRLPDGSLEDQFVERLRIYPHGLRDANAYYSPAKKALLFGYFKASLTAAGKNLPGGTIFSCLSYDVVAHEASHALLDGLHRRFIEATNPDMLAFHEAFSDIVALFQHFTHPEALRHQIAKSRGDLRTETLLSELAQQFGQAIGLYGSLRSGLGRKRSADGEAAQPVRYGEVSNEPHELGSVLVAAVFDAFLQIYGKRSRDLIRLATQGSGELPPGDIHPDLVGRLAQEASRTAEYILLMCIRALDYCPPVSLTFGDYLRALITADRDLEPDDPLGYRYALVSAFRSRGIFPDFVSSLSSESLRWQPPEAGVDNISGVLGQLKVSWVLKTGRKEAFETSRQNAGVLRNWLQKTYGGQSQDIEQLGFFLDSEGKAGHKVGEIDGELSPFEVHSVRPARRIGREGQHLTDIIVEITQSWRPVAQHAPGARYRGGCTLIVDFDNGQIRYCI